MKRLVLALGGNALGDSPQDQLEIVKETARPIVDLIEEGYEILIVHGNGPQVGMINKYMKGSNMPFAECGAMSQGYIGYHLQNALDNELKKRSIDRLVLTIISQVLVDKNDPAFDNPTKPIGEFYSKKEAKDIQDKFGYTMIEDSGRGYRRVVPSPKPKKLIEEKSLKRLLKKGFIVIAGGGGGIPVIEKDGGYLGIDGVIDKDYTAAMIANSISADALIILTAVDRVAINFGKENQKDLDKLSIKDAKKHLKAGEFASGSMGPKVEAAINFVEKKKNRISIITSLDKLMDGISGKTGTKIIK